MRIIDIGIILKLMNQIGDFLEKRQRSKDDISMSKKDGEPLSKLLTAA